jgi:hypothetical protein
MDANKIVKLAMVSDFNENWYLCYFEVHYQSIPHFKIT